MKALAQIILFVLCFFTTNYEAQIYFNNKFDTYGSCDATNGVDTMFNGYVSASITCSSLSFSTFVLSLYNLNGTINKKKVFFKPDNFRPNIQKYIRAPNNCFFVSGSRFYHSDTSLVFLWKFNSNLDSIKYSEFGFLNKKNFINSFVMHSNYLYHVGYVDSLNTNTDVLLVKTDTAGNEIWKKKIGVASWDEEGFSIDTIQNNLIISGNKYPHNTSNTSGFVMRLDTSGTIIWQKTVATNGGYGGSVAKTLKDGNVVIYSRYKMYTLATNDYYRLQVEKITPNNTSLWTQLYNAPTIEANPYSAIENKNGNIVIAGQKCYSPGLVVNGSVNEIAQNGDSLFSREYAYQFGCQNYFRDIVQAPDGGYCFAGFFYPVFANGCTGSQDVWLLKVDSNFCESNVSCGYPTGLSNINIQSEMINVFPNPTNNQITFMFGKEKQKNCTIEIYNANGQLVKNIGVAFDNESVSVEMQDLKDGIYFYRIYDNESQLKAGKIVLIK